ncbi:MATE family efflux transporter [Alteromonas sp. SM 2104]|nr:MATE family efflux transporter [Alteromonas oceanisediminis]
MLMGVADTIMAGRYSADDMAAVAIGFSITTPILMFLQGIALAIPPIVSRLVGQNALHLVANAAQQAFYTLITFSLLVYVLLAFIEPLLLMVPMAQELRTITTEYVSYVLIAVPAFALYQAARNYCEANSKTRPTMLITLFGLLINIPANYAFIYGVWGFPELGGAGCGIATGIVFVMMMMATLAYTAFSRSLKPLALFATFYRPDIRQMLGTLKLGLPIALTILFEVTLFSAVALLLAPFGAVTVAAHQIALNVSSLMFMFPLSIGMAVSIRIAFLIGQQRIAQAKLALKSALVLGLSIALFTASLTIFGRHLIPSWYTRDVAVLSYAAPLLLLAAMFQFSDAIQAICANALRGYKDTTAMFLITFVAYWLIGLPMGSVLALTDWLGEPLRAQGFWIGFIIGLSAAAFMLGIRVRIIQRRFALLS